MKTIKSLFSQWPYIWVFPLLFVAYFFSYPTVDFLNEQIYHITGSNAEISYSVFQVVLIGLIVFIASADFSLGGISFQFPWIFKYYKNKSLCSNDFLQLTAYQRQLFLFLYFALFMIVFALIIAAV